VAQLYPLHLMLLYLLYIPCFSFGLRSFQREVACYVLEYSVPKRYLYDSAYVRGKDKGKAIPIRAWTDPEGSKRLRLQDFKTIGT